MGGGQSKKQEVDIKNDIENAINNSINIENKFVQNTKQGITNEVDQKIALQCVDITAGSNIIIGQSAKIENQSIQAVKTDQSNTIKNEMLNSISNKLKESIDQLSSKGLNDILNKWSPGGIFGKSKEEQVSNVQNIIKNTISNSISVQDITEIINEQLVNNPINQIISLGGTLPEKVNGTWQDGTTIRTKDDLTQCDASKRPNIKLTAGGEIVITQEAAIQSTTKQIANTISKKIEDNKQSNQIINDLDIAVKQALKEMDPFAASAQILSGAVGIIIAIVVGVLLIGIVLFFVFNRSGSSSSQYEYPLEPPYSMEIMQPPSMSMQPQSMSMQPPSMSMQPPSMSMQPPPMSMQPPPMSMQPPPMSMQPSSMSMQPSSMLSPSQ
jgi:hypothetical protein